MLHIILLCQNNKVLSLMVDVFVSCLYGHSSWTLTEGWKINNAHVFFCFFFSSFEVLQYLWPCLSLFISTWLTLQVIAFQGIISLN